MTLLPETGLMEALQVAERIRREVEKHQDKAMPRHTVSLGVAAVNGGNGNPADLEALLAEADAALYRAKHGGRNRVDY